MIGLDTNVVVRLLVQDDAAQLRRVRKTLARECSEENPGLIGSIVLVETVRVFECAYQYGRMDIARALETLLRIRELEVQCRNEAWEALTHYRNEKDDFSDCYLAAVNRSLGCTDTLTLDRQAARLPSFRAI